MFSSPKLYYVQFTTTPNSSPGGFSALFQTVSGSTYMHTTAHMYTCTHKLFLKDSQRLIKGRTS